MFEPVTLQPPMAIRQAPPDRQQADLFGACLFLLILVSIFVVLWLGMTCVNHRRGLQALGACLGTVAVGVGIVVAVAVVLTIVR